MLLLHDFYSIGDAFKRLNEIDSFEFMSLEDIFSMQRGGKFKLHVVVNSSPTPILVEPRHWIDWLHCVTERDKLKEESRPKSIEIPGRQQKIKKHLSEVEVRLKELQKKIYEDFLPPSNNKNGMLLEVSRIDNKFGMIVHNFDSVDYYLIENKYRTSKEKINFYTKDNAVIGFVKEELDKLLREIKGIESNESINSNFSDTKKSSFAIASAKKRVHQLHTLIKKVDIFLTIDKISPTAQTVWNEIENNHFEYDDEAIIQEVKDNTIYWKSIGGIEQTLPLTSFSSTLSNIRRKHKDN